MAGAVGSQQAQAGARLGRANPRPTDLHVAQLRHRLGHLCGQDSTRALKQGPAAPCLLLGLVPSCPRAACQLETTLSERASRPYPATLCSLHSAPCGGRQRACWRRAAGPTAPRCAQSELPGGRPLHGAGRAASGQNRLAQALAPCCAATERTCPLPSNFFPCQLTFTPVLLQGRVHAGACPRERSPRLAPSPAGSMPKS